MTGTNPNAFPALPLSGGTVTGNLNVTGNIGATGHIFATAVAPGAVAGANAGTGPPAPVVVAGSSDNGGGITFGTGTTPAAGAQVVVTFAASYGVNPPGIAIVPGNTATQALGLYLSALAGTGFTVSCATAPAASQANTTYAFDWVTIG